MFVVDPTSLTSRERALLRQLEKEYTPKIAEDVLKPLLTKTSPVSLRALDWAVVNWAKQHNVICSSLLPGQVTNVHHAYRTTLSYWKRKLFDPFRRRSRIGVRIGDKVYDTTLGQANFAIWTYRTGVLGYVLGNIEAIESDMNAVSQRQKRERREAKRRGIRKKRSELTATPTSVGVAYIAPSKFTFE